jgi:uncharacterized protein YciI/uncharacterized protein YndB with AHSA1/START domain
MNEVPPIRREIVVDADADIAFDVFTAGIGRWWPLAELSVHGAGATVAFVDGEIVERSAAGDRAVWGSVTRWEPGAIVVFTWHPGQPPEHASEVEVTFTPVDGRTRVTLEHRGWEAFDDPARARAEYDEGWPMVLGRYQEKAARPDDGGDGETWVALMHRPGPNAPVDRPVVEDARFADHLAFLSRMHASGYLVAAGPFVDADGEGMTILRLPGRDRLEQATQLAREDDGSVAGGLLTVAVRPWMVMLRA